MKQLRLLHLYLGCFFAPLLVFFSVSGIWQIFGFQDARDATGHHTIFAYLSTIHTGHGLKEKHHSLSSVYLQWFAVLMAAGLVISIILGTILAFKFGRGRLALLSLLGGILIPLGLIWLFANS